MKERIQKINLNPHIGDVSTKEMYYRGGGVSYCDMEGNTFIHKGNFFDLFTYFNSLSIEKWTKYTYMSHFGILIDFVGDIEITLFGHYFEGNSIHKENLGIYKLENSKRKEIVLPIPSNYISSVVGMFLNTLSDVTIYDIAYVCETKEEVANPSIALVTTTFHKEMFINHNIDVLSRELFSDSEIGNAFSWTIVDNGSTLTEYDDGKIRIVHSHNIGGAGGFTKGIVISLRQEKKPTHILLMDDDVRVSIESFKRLFYLLKYLRPEYSKHFVGGAMINMDAPNIQHENTGVLVEEGYCKPVNSGFDLNLWDKVLLNEIIDEKVEYQYQAWWFCCMPTSVVTLENLPLPLFVRGDDMEYSLRNQAKFITMNGISIWHQGFVGKFNPIMDYYQSKRNELIVFSTNSKLSKIDSFSCIEELIWQELYKFDYNGASLLIDAVEDYLKGPQWFSSQDLFNVLESKSEKRFSFLKINEEVRKLIDYHSLYTHTTVNWLKKLIYDYSYNGQSRVPLAILKRRKIGIIPYGWGYFPEKQILTSINYAIDPVHDRYVVFTRDRTKFKELKERFLKVKREYIARKADICSEYRNCVEELSKVSFWDSYLKK